MRSFSAAALAISILLCGCSEPSKPACPPLGDYDPAFRTKLAAELHRLGEGSASAQVVEDYALLRAQVRACG